MKSVATQEARCQAITPKAEEKKAEKVSKTAAGSQRQGFTVEYADRDAGRA